MPLQYQHHVESFNYARNCLQHANGIVAAKQCNNPAKNKLTIYGNKFRFFFLKDGAETPMEFGKPGPENAALMMGAEEFKFEFGLGQSLQLSMDQFLSILNGCVFIRADIESVLPA